VKPSDEQQSLFFSPEGFHNHASPFPSPASEKERQTTVTSGRKCSALLTKPGPVSACVRMCLASSRWHSTAVSLTWKVLATPSGRLLFQLVPSGRRTVGAGSGSAPTTTGTTPAMLLTPKTPTGGPQPAGRTKPGGGLRKLEDQIAMLHTPSGQEPGVSAARLRTKDGEPAKVGERAYDATTGRLAQVGLTQQIAMLPTPAAHDHHIGYQDRSETPGKQENVETVVRNATGGKSRGLRLQPSFVEWMMGYPLGFTDIEYNASRRSGTASSRRSQRKSSAR
jgi:hypothetical protein